MVIKLIAVSPVFFDEQGEGSAVAVERVFFGGCDTISLRRASLRPETIKKFNNCQEEASSDLKTVKYKFSIQIYFRQP